MNRIQKLEFLAKRFLEENGENSRKELEYMAENLNLNLHLPKKLTPESVVESVLASLTSGFQDQELEDLLATYQDLESLEENFTLTGLIESTSMGEM